MSPLKCTLLLACCLGTTAWAADSPDASDPAPAPPPVAHHHSGLRAQRRNGAFLGISTSPASRVVQQQLGLPEGMGLVVDFIAPQSPAEQAGLREYDVLQKLDDQLLINSEQLAILVRSHKPGDEVKLTVLRDGKPQTITVKLAVHELEPLDSFDFDRVFPPRPMLPPFGRHVPPPVPPVEHPDASGPATSSSSPAATGPDDHDYTVTYVDGNRVYSISLRGGHQSLTVNDADHTLFDGPIDTQRQRDRLPPDIRATLDRMIRSNLLPVLPAPAPVKDRDGSADEKGTPPGENQSTQPDAQRTPAGQQ